MNTFITFVIVLAIVCVFGFFNEKVTKLNYEISLMLFSIIAGLLILAGTALFTGTGVGDLLKKAQFFDIESFLLEGGICFMLFAGSCHMKLGDFKEQARQVTVLSFVCTLLGAVFYGLLFYCASLLLKLGLSIPVCLMFGSIVAPTDPIAATSILNKFGLPQKTSFLIQGESLFNDGVGVALFVCFSGMAAADASQGFFSVMFREIIGAVVVGLVMTALCFIVFRFSKNNALAIAAALTAVSGSYLICERFDFSGAIASVVCGIMFSALRAKFCPDDDSVKAQHFDYFWENLDVLMNSILYVMIGLSFVHIMQMQSVILLSLIAILANFIARSGSVSLSTLIMGKIPDGFSRLNFIKLLTWGGLRGGLSIALAMSTKEIVPENIYYIILGGTYAIVFFTTAIQGLTMKSVYKRICRSEERRKQKT